MSEGSDIIYAAIEKAKSMNEKEKIGALLGLCIERMQEIGEAEGVNALAKEAHPFEHTISLDLITMAVAIGIMDEDQMKKTLGLDGLGPISPRVN